MTNTDQTETLHPDEVRIIIVDDSTVIRNIVRRVLTQDPNLKVVSTAENGEAAIQVLRAHPADVIILDVEMPVMDGMTAIPQLKAVDPAVQIIMASALTQKNAEVSLKALDLGATDYIPKPSSAMSITASTDFSNELIAKVKALGLLARRKGVRGARAGRTPAVVVRAEPEKKKIALRPEYAGKPAIIAIGSSTGGPEALHKVIRQMGSDLPQPVVITQHMPATFTSILAEHITRQCKVNCIEGKNGEILKPGQYYLAPGDFHMLFVRTPQGTAIKLDDGPRENFCRPAVDPMLRSLVEIYGKRILTVMLTGMGQDGWKGSEAVVAAGGGILAQDEATSVVWGMPGAVAMAGLCSSVLPINDIGHAIRHIAMRVA